MRAVAGPSPAPARDRFQRIRRRSHPHSRNGGIHLPACIRQDQTTCPHPSRDPPENPIPHHGPGATSSQPMSLANPPHLDNGIPFRPPQPMAWTTWPKRTGVCGCAKSASTLQVVNMRVVPDIGVPCGGLGAEFLVEDGVGFWSRRRRQVFRPGWSTYLRGGRAGALTLAPAGWSQHN